MAKRCPRGFVCSDRTTLWIAVIAIAALVVSVWFVMGAPKSSTPPQIYVMQQPAAPAPAASASVRPDIYPEPVLRQGFGLPSIPVRGPAGPFQQIGIITGEGGSSSSAAPDRTILPLYGRELDPRRGRWNYYTRTDGANPVQIPVRYQNRLCDDDSNGCQEIYSDDSVNVPALGRSFKATVYKKTFGF